MSLGNIGAYASNFVSQFLSPITGILGGAQSPSSNSGNFAIPALSTDAQSLANNLTGIGSNLSSQVMSTLLQAQEQGSAAVQSATNSVSQALQSNQQSQQQQGSGHHHHHFNLGGINQLVQSLDQTMTSTASNLSNIATSAAAAASSDLG